MSLRNALIETGLTANGAVTNVTTDNALVDFVGLAGSGRNMKANDICVLFINAFNSSEHDTIKLLFWLRDVRGGAGERNSFRVMLNYLASTSSTKYQERMKNLIPYIVEYGRWDDLFCLFDTPLEYEALCFIRKGLENSDGLIGKWMPRKGDNAKKIRAFLGWSPKQYRKTIVGLSNTVEQLMCSKQFDKINYEHVPSVASARYKTAFHRNDGERYSTYVEAVTSGEKKMNASVVFPHDVLKPLQLGWNSRETAVNASVDAQWASLPNMLEGNEENLLTIVDVSGSMNVQVSGNTTAMDVAISLGLYISERQAGEFKDCFLTFSYQPVLQVLNGTPSQKARQLRRARWAMNTDLEETFRVLLSNAVEYSVDKKDMPTKLIILSDMEFDVATRGHQTNFKVIDQLYNEAGYERPDILFWNINGRVGNTPITVRDNGTALVSGFSPNILKAVLNGSLSPTSVVDSILQDKRYSVLPW